MNNRTHYPVVVLLQLSARQPTKGKVMANNKYRKLAMDIYDFCAEYELWHDIIIYFDGIAWSAHNKWNGISGAEIEPGLFEYCNKNPLDYFEYANPDTLSVSFEGPLYNIVNYYFDSNYYSKLHEKFCKIFDKYDVWFEQGHAWNLSVYEN